MLVESTSTPFTRKIRLKTWGRWGRRVFDGMNSVSMFYVSWRYITKYYGFGVDGVFRGRNRNMSRILVKHG